MEEIKSLLDRISCAVWQQSKEAYREDRDAYPVSVNQEDRITLESYHYGVFYPGSPMADMTLWRFLLCANDGVPIQILNCDTREVIEVVNPTA